MSLDRGKLQIELVAMLNALGKLDPNADAAVKQAKLAELLSKVIDDYVRQADVVGVTVFVTPTYTLAQDNRGKLQ